MRMFSNINNKSEKLEYHQSSKCLYIMLRTLICRHQLSLQSDCLFSQNYIHYDETVLIYWENTENYYLS